jgi:hypothetical protein
MTDLFPPDHDAETVDVEEEPLFQSNVVLPPVGHDPASASAVMATAMQAETMTDSTNNNNNSSSSSSSFQLLSNLPRSVRWRIQLGLLETGLDAGPTLASVDTLYDCNQVLIEQQRRRFQELMEKYVTPEEEETTTTTTPEPSNESPAPSPSMMLDPLTAMVMEQEQQETRKQELYLKYRKERARRKRGLSTELTRRSTTTGGSLYEEEEAEEDGIDRASVRIVGCACVCVFLPEGHFVWIIGLTTSWLSLSAFFPLDFVFVGSILKS